MNNQKPMSSNTNQEAIKSLKSEINKGWEGPVSKKSIRQIVEERKLALLIKNT
jgi:hypothetical protein